MLVYQRVLILVPIGRAFGGQSQHVVLYEPFVSPNHVLLVVHGG